MGYLICIFEILYFSERKSRAQRVSQIYIRHVSVILTGKVNGIIRYYSSIRGSKNRLCSNHRNSKDKEKEGKTAAQVDVRPETRSWAMVVVMTWCFSSTYFWKFYYSTGLFYFVSH